VSQKTNFLRNHFDDRINTLHNNNKTDFLSKFESLKCNSFGFIQNIKFSHIHIHGQYIILSWIYYKLCHNEWYKNLKSLFTLTISWEIARSPILGIFGSNLISDKYEVIFCNRKP
jgi:hypothetical protein